MDRRLTGVAAVTTALLAGAAWWWAQRPVQATVEPATADVPAAPRRLQRAEVIRAESAPAPPQQAPVPLAPPSPKESALQVLAEYAGEGMVRCPVGDMVPDGMALGLSHGVVEHGVLIGTVLEPDGDARVHLPGDAASDPPRAVVRWTGAWPGEEGRCEALLPELVSVEGWVTDPMGALVSGGQVGNAIDGTWPIDADGAFMVECWRGTRCPLAARTAVGEPWGNFVPVVADGPTWGVELVLEADPPQELIAFLEEQVAESERLAKMPDPLAMALKHPLVPDEARPMLEAWMAEEAAERASAAALLAELRDWPRID